jgi:hypothetical protein
LWQAGALDSQESPDAKRDIKTLSVGLHFQEESFHKQKQIIPSSFAQTASAVYPRVASIQAPYTPSRALSTPQIADPTKSGTEVGSPWAHGGTKPLALQ